MRRSGSPILGRSIDSRSLSRPALVCGGLLLGLSLVGLLAPASLAQEPPAKKPSAADKNLDSPGKKPRSKKEQAPAEPIPGYNYQQIEGFHVLLNKELLKHEEDSQFERKPLAVLEMELKLIAGLFPSRAVALLRTVPIWAEWKKEGYPGAVAVYHGGPTDRDQRRGVIFRFRDLEQQVKSNAIEIVDMELLTAEHQPRTDSGRCVLLHELSHAVHHHLFESDNPVIKGAYERAMQQGLYNGRYASANNHEYFAELSCAFFDKLAYEPQTRQQLKAYDPIGYQMMEATWGTPQQINAARDAEAKKSYGKARATMRGLIQNGDVEGARAQLGEFTHIYRDTKTAEMAQKQFEEFVAAEQEKSKSARSK